MKLTAQKRLRRGGQWVEPGEAFEVRSAGEARALKALGKARDFVEPEVERDHIREALREHAEALGVEVDGRWGVPRLEEEIAAAEQKAAHQTHTRRLAAEADETPAAPASARYRRRDMRSEDE